MTRILALLIALPLALGAAEGPLADHPLPDIKGSIQIPQGWTSTQEAEDGVFVYHFGKGEGAGATSMTLSVTTKVPDRTSQKPTEYAEALIDMSQDGASSAPLQKGTLAGLPSLRSEYDFESDTGKMRAVNIAVSNDKTGTLYFFAWQAPMDESLELEAVRDKILSSAKFDPEF